MKSKTSKPFAQLRWKLLVRKPILSSVGNFTVLVAITLIILTFGIVKNFIGNKPADTSVSKKVSEIRKDIIETQNEKPIPSQLKWKEPFKKEQ